MLVGVQVLVFAALVAENFERTVGDHLVGVHVGRGAGAPLDHVDDKLIVQLAGDDLVAGDDDGVGDFFIEQAQLLVGERGGLLDLGERPDQPGVSGNGDAADREILSRAQRMHAVIGLRGNVAVAEQVVFASKITSHVCLLGRLR